MKTLLGLVMVVGGIVLGLYMGLWVCFIGGIVQIINEIKSPEVVVAMSIAFGIVKILFAGLVGWISALVLIIPGGAMLSK